MFHRRPEDHDMTNDNKIKVSSYVCDFIAIAFPLPYFLFFLLLDTLLAYVRVAFPWFHFDLSEYKGCILFSLWICWLPLVCLVMYRTFFCNRKYYCACPRALDDAESVAFEDENGKN